MVVWEVVAEVVAEVVEKVGYFLVTEQVGDFDPAESSRFHFSSAEPAIVISRVGKFHSFQGLGQSVWSYSLELELECCSMVDVVEEKRTRFGREKSHF